MWTTAYDGYFYVILFKNSYLNLSRPSVVITATSSAMFYSSCRLVPHLFN